MANNNRGFNFKDWILTGWGAVIVLSLGVGSGIFKGGYELGQWVANSDHRDVVTNMRVDFQEKLLDAKEKAEGEKEAALRDLAKEKKEELDKLYLLVNSTKR